MQNKKKFMSFCICISSPCKCSPALPEGHAACRTNRDPQGMPPAPQPDPARDPGASAHLSRAAFQHPLNFQAGHSLILLHTRQQQQQVLLRGCTFLHSTTKKSPLPTLGYDGKLAQLAMVSPPSQELQKQPFAHVFSLQLLSKSSLCLQHEK